jgi:hypothetical protein
LLVLVVVLDCFPRRADRGRRRPRARSGKIPPLLFSCSFSSSCSIVFLAGQTEDDDDHEHDQEKSAASLSCSSSSSCSIAFLAGRTEDDDDHEHDQEKSAASLSCSSSSSCSIAFLAGRTEDDDDHEHDQEKSRRFFIVLVLVVVLDCFPRRADRGRRRPRARSGDIEPEHD